MNTTNNSQIVYESTYKVFNGVRYHLKFPDEWILNELPDTGRDCPNCVERDENGTMTGYAVCKGIVLGYCLNCASYSYNCGRGPGLNVGIPIHQRELEHPFLNKHDLEEFPEMFHDYEDYEDDWDYDLEEARSMMYDNTYSSGNYYRENGILHHVSSYKK